MLAATLGRCKTGLQRPNVRRNIRRLQMCLLNTGEPIYRHLSHHSFFVSDISVCDPSLAPEFDWQTHSDLSESDHYPVILKTSPRDK